MSGGKPFDRRHIHHILSNPIYAGPIQHKGQVHEGPHPAIIDPEIWERVQTALQGGAERMRGTKQQGVRSPLAGKLFDETGDRLTPSHSWKNGKRLPYYISRRLITDRSRQHPDAWRLPADQVEDLLLGLVRQQFARPNTAALIVQEVSAAELPGIRERLNGRKEDPECLALIARADLCPGSLKLRLDLPALAQLTALVGMRSMYGDPALLELLERAEHLATSVELRSEDATLALDASALRRDIGTR